MSLSKRAIEKYKPWGLFSEFYGIFLLTSFFSVRTVIYGRSFFRSVTLYSTDLYGPRTRLIRGISLIRSAVTIWRLSHEVLFGPFPF